MEKIGVCQGSGKILLRASVGQDNLSVSRNGRKFYTLVNGRAVAESKSEKEFASNGAPTAAVLLKALLKQNGGPVNIKSGPEYRQMLDALIKNIKDNLGDAEVLVLQEVPDEMHGNSSAELQASYDKLSGYCGDLGVFKETIENASHLSEVLLKTSLPKTMWGGKEVGVVLHEVKTAMDHMRPIMEEIEACVEQSENGIGILQSIGKTASKEQLRFKKETAGRVIEHFSTLKTVTSGLVQALQKLYGIDSTFKKSTGYPATWFFNSSIFFDFMYEFDNLVDNLIKMTKIESGTIEPLLIWKVKTGE